MAQPVTALLARQHELAAAALSYTGDTNEANLLVGRVLGRAVLAQRPIGADALKRELEGMIAALRKPPAAA